MWAKNGPERYRGRFAPSPSGLLHFGSLLAALGSWADARHHQGEWWVRIEDLDPPRVQAGAAAAILRTLERFGLHWDGVVWYQSQRQQAYHQAIEQLREAGLLYPCRCSRRKLRETGQQGRKGVIYSGRCRQRPATATTPPAALRVVTESTPIGFCDRRHGSIEQVLEREVGDFVLRRADGLFAYQLAVVVDDAAQGITHIVRGSDLLFSTPRQIYLQRLLGLATPEYLHLPLVYGEDGRKLSKQEQAHPVDLENPLLTLRAAWQRLGQIAPGPEVTEVAQFTAFAARHWVAQRVPIVETGD